MMELETIMTTDVVSVTAQTELKELAALFQKHNFSSMPVVDSQSELVGIITTTDLIELDTELHIPTVISIFDWVVLTLRKEVLLFPPCSIASRCCWFSVLYLLTPALMCGPSSEEQRLIAPE